MIQRSYNRILPGAILGCLLSLSTLLGQQQNQAGYANGFSAKMEAIQYAGTVPDEGGKGEVIGKALYVKLQSGYVATSLPEAAAMLAFGAGLGVATASNLPYVTLPDSKSTQSRIQAMSPARRTKVLQAKAVLLRIIEVHYSADIHPRRAAALLQGIPGVEYAEPIRIPKLMAPDAADPNDPLLPEQKQLDRIKALDAWQIWQGDTNLVIGIVDAGINMFHPDLAPNIKENPGEVGPDGLGGEKQNNGKDDDNNGVIDDWRGANLTHQLDGTIPGNTYGSSHGTEVTGYAAAATDNGIGVAGVGNKCKFFPVRAFANGRGLVRAYEGVLYCAQRGFKVINCSWGDIVYSQAEADIIANIIAAYDVAIVAAAGNDPEYNSQFPAGYPGVMGVGGFDDLDVFLGTWGEQIDISARAGYTTAGDTSYYNLGSATSYTAGVLSGVVALVRSKYPELTGEQALAHIRLTADNIDNIQLQKAKLIGYGAVNALRAVQEDPFSHPAFVVDSVWLEDIAGQPHGLFEAGEQGIIRFRMKNILGDATDVQIHPVGYTSDTLSIALQDTIFTFNTVPGNEAGIVEAGIPFTVRASGKPYTRIRFDVQATGYDDYQYERLYIYRPYTVYSTPRMSVSISDAGRIGFDRDQFGAFGVGLAQDGVSHLYEGGLIVATGPFKILDNVRRGGTREQGSDFTLVEQPSEQNEQTYTFNDTGADESRRIGVELRMRGVTVDTVANAIGIEVRAKNTSANTIDSLRVGMFADWDLDGDDGGQSVEYVPGGDKGIAFYGRVKTFSGSYISSGVAAPVGSPIFYAMQNNADPTNLYDGFDDGEKWIVIGSNVGKKTVGPADIGLVTGATFPQLAPGEEDTVLFVIGASPLMLASAEDAMWKFVGYSGTSSVDDRGADENAGHMSAAIPNPTNGNFRFAVQAGRNSTLRLYDVAGMLVADLTHLLPESGRGEIVFNAADMPSGLYTIRLVTGGKTGMQNVLLLR